MVLNPADLDLVPDRQTEKAGRALQLKMVFEFKNKVSLLSKTSFIPEVKRYFQTEKLCRLLFSFCLSVRYKHFPS